MHRRLILVLIVGVGSLALVSLAVLRARFPRQELRTCFADAGGLRPGAEVRISGVQVGIVRAVTAQPQNKDCPAEVEMDLTTPYELKIPRDAIAEVQTAGLMGPAIVAIDVKHSTGEAATKGSYLKSKNPATDAPAAH